MTAAAHTPPARRPGPRRFGRRNYEHEERVVSVAQVYSSRRLSQGRLLALAAVTPADADTDPVNGAIAASLERNRPDIHRLHAAPGAFDPATPQRRYSIADVEGFIIDQHPVRLRVLRGEAAAVCSVASLSAPERAPFLRHIELMERTGYRCLVVASAPIDAAGSVGTYRVEGFIALAVEPLSVASRHVSRNPNSWVRVNLWSATLRFQHWANMFLIIGMTITGYFIMDPDVLPTPEGDTGYMFGWIRFIHFACGFGWLVLGLSRFWLAFVARDRQLRWRSLWPLNSAKDVSGLIGTIRYYLFIDKEGPVYLGHNPLQQLSYTAIYVLCLVQMLTGVALYGLANQYHPLWRIFSAPAHWIGVPYLRVIHAFIMFIIWAFVIMHVYLAVRADSVERHGGISSMINGGVWLRRGTQPMDAPKIG